MGNVEDCIFCKIASGQMGVPFVYEDENVVAFNDINPQAPVHTLIVPKTHFANLNDGPCEDVLGRLFGAVSTVAQIQGVDRDGYRIIQNNGPAAGQTVYHMHVHLLGGTQLGEGLV